MSEDLLFLEKIPSAAVPANDDAKRIFDSFKIGQKFEVIPWSDRNYKFHQKLFSLLGLITENNPNWKSRHFVLKLIQMDIGSTEVGMDMNGIVQTFPKSISFKRMSEVEFTKLFSKTIDHMLENLAILIPGMPERVFNSYVQRILDYDR